MCITCRRPTIFIAAANVRGGSLHRGAASHLLSLAPLLHVTRIIIVATMTTMARTRAAEPIRRLQEINGRTYAIEALPVDRDRWRARLAQSGTTNALMPFYGTTPDEAIDQLTAWLLRVGRPSSPRQS